MDYRNFGTGTREERERTVRWWVGDCDESDAANAITDALKLLGDQQSVRVTQYARDARLYGNAATLRMSGLPAFQMPSVGSRFGGDRSMSFNVVQSVIDTVVSRIGKNRPRPYFLTSGGDYKQQKKAKRLNLFCEGLFYENKAHRMGAVALRDGCVWGDGIIHIFMRDGRVRWERTLPFELFVDEVEGIHGTPRQLYRVKDVDRALLLERFPDAEDVIDTAPMAGYGSGVDGKTADMVTVREAWHLPSAPGAKDGKHCISVENGLLTDIDPWEHDFFPFARFGWNPNLVGFWSQGLASQLQSVQFEINELLQTIQKSHRLGGTFKLLVENGSKVVKDHLNNEVGAVVTYSGTKPDYVTPPLVQPERYAYVQQLKRDAYEQAGVSMMSATSQKPLGIESGKAIRTLNDIENDRFRTFGENYQNFYMDLAEISIALVAAKGGEYKVRTPGVGKVTEIDWADIDLPRDAYIMQCFPVSSLPSDPAGRLQTVQDFLAAGMITPRRARKLMDFPDLEAEESLANAAEEYLEMTLDLIVEDGIFTPPEPFDDLVLAKEMALQYYAAGKSSGLAEDRLELLRTFIQMIVAMEKPPPPVEPETGQTMDPNQMPMGVDPMMADPMAQPDPAALPGMQ